MTLEYVLDRTDSWLKFAEAKNGALLALNCALLFGLVRVGLAVEELPLLIGAYMALAGVFLLVGITLTLMSFLPRLEPPLWIKYPETREQPNVLFFGDVCRLTATSYIERFNRIASKDESFSEQETQFAEQIVTNSKIAYIKHTQFTYAAWFTLGALLTPVGAWWLCKVKT